MQTNQEESSFEETIEQVVRFLVARRWWILVTATIVPLLTTVVLFRLPDRYTSEATLVSVQQQVSQRYVLPTTTMTIADEIQGMSREVLSRTRLRGVIDEFGLYAKARKTVPPAQIVELMRRDIDVLPLDLSRARNDYNAFKISYTVGNARLAQAVTSRLTQLFIQENLKNRESEAASTNSFLKDQLDAARQKLAQQEQHIRDFKTRNVGELPEQQQANVEALTDYRTQLQTTLTNLSRAEQQRSSLQNAIEGIVARLKSERADLLNRFTPRHPEVVKKDEEIARAEMLLEGLTIDGSRGDLRQASADPALSQYANQVEAIRLETEALTKQQKQLVPQIAQYESRLDLTPAREQELSALLHEYDLLSQDYRDLQMKQSQSELANSMEERQAGQRFRLVDPPTLPVIPSSPQREKISLGALGGGIVLGLALAFLMEKRDTSFHSEKAVQRRFAPPLLVGVPLLLTFREKRLRIWKNTFQWIGAATMAGIVLAAEYYVYRHN